MIEPHLMYFSTTHDRLKKLGVRIAGRKYTASEFTNLIRRQFPASDFIIRTFRDTTVDPDMIIVSGLYDCYDDSNHLPSITITLCYHPAQDAYFVDLINWEQFCFDVAECVGHEMVHRDQFKNGRKPAMKPYKSTHLNERVREDQQYLGAEDEIEAYGFSIAAEMHSFNKTMHDCVMYNVYRDTFEADMRIVLQLEKQIGQYHRTLEKIYEQTN